ncbi:response regulator transcription factor [Spirosoma sp. KCTC 42546]|uniref:LytR/AlgR family response regulator transcription factor n=1 Tax=Spirosoma sp. KCTC 42546 TaxID=2520506 RepID=UPI00115C1684|nr:LytTR family DNA-binding domain-containing protein [Spirosoma sp. KCTC 42546]QDK82387.1 response regulator transcription factor [Spirosoma sp. KCTC 42546]
MKDILTCYLVDDESPAHVIMSKYISRVPYLALLGQTYDPFEGLEQVQQRKPDILFLDVEMPYMTGVEFLKSLQKPHPMVIMVTASPQFAAETYNFDAVTHYLLKPVGFDKFLEAINRVTKRLNFEIDPNAPTPTRPPARVQTQAPVDPREKIPYFLIKEDKKLIRVAPEDIVFAEGMKDYLKLHLTTRVLITHMTMSKLEEMLPPSQFLRINRSYIVRRQAIKEIDGNQITTLDGKKVVIGVTYRERVMEELKKNMI